jgi:hypothetical protein
MVNSIANTEEMTPQELLEGFEELVKSGETANLRHWGDGKFVLGDGNGKWHYEGFVSLLRALHEALRAVDPTIPPGLPPHVLDPQVIAKFFCLKLEDMNYQGEAKLESPLGEVEAKLDRILANTESLVGQRVASTATSTPSAFTKKELARRFQISTRTVDRWRSMGIDLGEITIGGIIRFNPDKVAAIIATQKIRRRRT